MLLALWWTQPDLNRQPLACKASALPVGAMGPYRVRVCGPHSLGNNMFRNTKYSDWWGIRDSNPYALRHWSLNPARLPIPPIPHIGSFREPLGMRAFLFTQKSARQYIKDFASRFLFTMVKRSPTGHGLYLRETTWLKPRVIFIFLDSERKSQKSN